LAQAIQILPSSLRIAARYSMLSGVITKHWNHLRERGRLGSANLVPRTGTSATLWQASASRT